MSSTLISALAGLGGVVLGGFIQFLLTHASNLRDQRRVYDQRRFERRSDLYLRVLVYVDRLERRSGRSFTEVIFGKQRYGGIKRAQRELQSLAVELKIYGSWVTMLQFSSWKVLYTEHTMAVAIRDGLSAAAAIDQAQSGFVARAQRLVEVTNRRAGEMAYDLARQIQEELLGKEYDGIGYRFRRWRRRRIDDTKKAEMNAYVDNELESLGTSFANFLERSMPNVPAAGEGSGAEVHGARSVPTGVESQSVESAESQQNA